MSAPGLHPIEASELHARRERVFLVVSGLFLGSLAMLNILGLTRFIDLSFTVFGVDIPMPLAVGVLPYPVTFLCTDIISEIYGRKRASNVVWMGFVLNMWVAFILWLGNVEFTESGNEQSAITNMDTANWAASLLQVPTLKRMVCT